VSADGLFTRWGNWDPYHINQDYTWSDQRGLNSLQILAFLRVALNVSTEYAGILQDAYSELCNSTNQYDLNTVRFIGVAVGCGSGELGRVQINTKIEGPIDDNYSDDELAFLPYFSFFAASSDAVRSMCSLVASTLRVCCEFCVLFLVVHAGSVHQHWVATVVWCGAKRAVRCLDCNIHGHHWCARLRVDCGHRLEPAHVASGLVGVEHRQLTTP
jgi:hypothetical protein